MVVTKNRYQRYAFTMIELIFAIVIIGISVISLPMMMQVTSKGIESNILQEAIFSASAELMGASAGYWDERSMEDEANDMMSRVVDISGDCDTNRLRPGHINQPFHRRCLDSTLATGLDSTTNGLIISLDDTKHTSEDIFMNISINSTGYKQTYKSIIDVARTNNIKFIQATITDSKSPANTLVVLKMQSANIGEVEFYKRRF